MTPEQHRKIAALADLRLAPTDRNVNFIANMATFSKMYPENELPERLDERIDGLCRKYRHMITGDLVTGAVCNGV